MKTKQRPAPTRSISTNGAAVPPLSAPHANILRPARAVKVTLPDMKPPHYRNITRCRLCGSTKLKTAIKIPSQYIASTFVKSNEDYPMSKIKIPMTLLLCGGCGLCQLKETVRPALLYMNYFYRSNVSNTMKRDLGAVVADALSRVDWKTGDAVLDIGCNDGLTISMFPAELDRHGIDPAQNIDWSHLPPSIKIINDYFPSELIKDKKFKIITSTAMFYDLDDPNAAVKAIKQALHKDGVACIQVSYLYATIKDMNFYDICHEHLEYYSLQTLRTLMERNGMRIFDASINDVNGGSIRILATHAENKRPESESIGYILLKEKVFRLDDPETYTVFSKLISHSISQVRNHIRALAKKGQTIIALGASTKGNVLLQLCEIGKDTIAYISERNPLKVGLRTLGTDMELISEESARKMNPGCMFVIPWNFKSEIIAREKAYLDGGGKLLFIMPYPHLVDKNGERPLIDA